MSENLDNANSKDRQKWYHKLGEWAKEVANSVWYAIAYPLTTLQAGPELFWKIYDLIFHDLCPIITDVVRAKFGENPGPIDKITISKTKEIIKTGFESAKSLTEVYTSAVQYEEDQMPGKDGLSQTRKDEILTMTSEEMFESCENMVEDGMDAVLQGQRNRNQEIQDLMEKGVKEKDWNLVNRAMGLFSGRIGGENLAGC